MPTSTDTRATADRLRPILLHISRHLRRETHALGLSNGQVTMLATILHNPGIGIGDLAGLERMSAPSMCTHIDRLEAAGMVERQRDSEDRRRVGLTITREGERMLREVKSKRTAWLAARLARLAPEQIAAIDSAVDALAALVSEP